MLLAGPPSLLGHPYNKENSAKTVLVHLLVQIIKSIVLFAGFEVVTTLFMKIFPSYEI
jgi:hypothetical protein